LSGGARNDEASPILETTPAIAAEQFDGVTPAIDFDACRWQETGGGWLALIHETELREGEQYGRHRWVWFDEASALRGVSPPFCFGRKGIEQAAGLAPHPDGRYRLISYGIADDEGWLATETPATLANCWRMPSTFRGGEADKAAAALTDALRHLRW